MGVTKKINQGFKVIAGFKQILLRTRLRRTDISHVWTAGINRGNGFVDSWINVVRSSHP
jgi:hypothetical protein